MSGIGRGRDLICRPSSSSRSRSPSWTGLNSLRCWVRERGGRIFIVAWVVYSSGDERVGLPNVVYVQVGCLLWLALATSALCLVLTRRVGAGPGAAGCAPCKLVSEAMQADERHNRVVRASARRTPAESAGRPAWTSRTFRNRPTAASTDSTPRCVKPSRRRATVAPCIRRFWPRSA